MREIPFEEMPIMLGSFPVGRFDGHVVVDLGDDPRDGPEVSDVIVYSDTWHHDWTWDEPAANRVKRTHVSLRARATANDHGNLDTMLWKGACEDTRYRMQTMHREYWAEERARRASCDGINPGKLLKSEVI